MSPHLSSLPFDASYLAIHTPQRQQLKMVPFFCLFSCFRVSVLARVYRQCFSKTNAGLNCCPSRGMMAGFSNPSHPPSSSLEGPTFHLKGLNISNIICLQTKPVYIFMDNHIVGINKTPYLSLSPSQEMEM